MAAWRYEISLLELKKYFTRSLRSLVKYFQHSKSSLRSWRTHIIPPATQATRREISYLRAAM